MEAPESEAHFGPGEVVRHLRFDYRGVIADVDPTFSASPFRTDEARIAPP